MPNRLPKYEILTKKKKKVALIKPAHLLFFQKTYKLSNGGITTAANESKEQDWIPSPPLSMCLMAELEILPKNTEVADSLFDLALKLNPARLESLEVICLTCIEDLQRPGFETC